MYYLVPGSKTEMILLADTTYSASYRSTSTSSRVVHNKLGTRYASSVQGDYLEVLTATLAVD